jgi:transcription elongation factor GreB
MSRAFVKDEAPEAPLVVPPRAPLPDGVPNYVTPEGLAALRAERAALEAERAALDALPQDDDARRRERRAVGQRLADLLARIAMSRVVDPARQTPGVVRFGATVTVEPAGDPGQPGQAAGDARTLRIVGVDEAAAPAPDDSLPRLAGVPRVAFTSPVARALTGRAVGDEVTVSTPRGDERLRIAGVTYD